jgi:tRNA(Ile)-lysidine synthase
MDYLKAAGLSYVTDSSNQDTRFLRNRIRKELLPRFLNEQPRFLEHIGELTAQFREEDAFLDRQAAEWIDRQGRGNPAGHLIVPLKGFLNLAPAMQKRVIRQGILRVGKSLRRVESGHVHQVLGLAGGVRPQGEGHFPGGLRVKRRYDHLVFSTGENEDRAPYMYVFERPGDYPLESLQRAIRLKVFSGCPREVREGGPWTAYFDRARVAFPLVLRSFRPGDRFVPLGMTGRKKIKDFFIDHKVPAEVRSQTPILLSGDDPIWVCGFQMDDRYRVTPETQTCLKVWFV